MSNIVQYITSLNNGKKFLSKKINTFYLDVILCSQIFGKYRTHFYTTKCDYHKVIFLGDTSLLGNGRKTEPTNNNNNNTSGKYIKD